MTQNTTTLYNTACIYNNGMVVMILNSNQNKPKTNEKSNHIQVQPA